MRIWSILIPLLCCACATNSAEASKSYRYVHVSPGQEFAYVINPDKGQLVPVLERALDTVPIAIEVCDSRSGFLCFYGSGVTFGVPRNGL